MVALTLAGGGLSVAATASSASARAAATPTVTMVIDWATGHKTISPLIYGMADDADLDANFNANLTLTRAGLVRLGGNRWTAYNWVNNASNAGADYQYENDNYLTPSTVPGYAILPTVQGAQAHGAASIVTVPINGYVSADESPPGPVMNSGPNYLQTRFKVEVPTDPNPLTTTPDPNAPQVYENQFVYWLMKTDPTAHVLFSLDNEPDLWDSTHLEVHKAQTTYAEVLSKDLAYAKAIKAVWPAAEVTGPVSYGWEGYETLQNAPDSGADGNFLDWYLKNVAAADKSAGSVLINDLDLHWYPEATDAAGTRITGTDITPAEVVAREQAPRSLWDPTYVENSWITADSTGGKAIDLIPRTDGQIAANDPAMKLAFTEWNYGGGQDISGGIASADVLGIFGKYGVHAASWWGLNSNETYSLAAFSAFRNYNGHGAGFGDTELSATTSDPVNTSVYASRNSKNDTHVVVVAINKNNTPTTAAIQFTGGFSTTTAAVYTLTSAGAHMVSAPSITTSSTDTFDYTMPAQSVSVIVPAYAKVPAVPGSGSGGSGTGSHGSGGGLGNPGSTGGGAGGGAPHGHGSTPGAAGSSASAGSAGSGEYGPGVVGPMGRRTDGCHLHLGRHTAVVAVHRGRLRL
ncbi:MAG TPA: glycoside hydrolase family 44 protein [Acidimicrobiales bacterium]|nr:glycoside hydrolase family 44 protein [Acidimicrobiales bacterium]